MTTYRIDWDSVRRAYSPDRISEYVERGLERMYFGAAPTLSAINADYGNEKYEGLVALLIDEIFKFAGLKDRFDAEVMNTVAHTIRTEYPWLKITELMHFVYLFRLGTFDKFYGKPNGATLMQMLRQYIKSDREKTRMAFIERREKEERIIELARRRQPDAEAMAQMVSDKLAQMLSEEERAKAEWRYRPYGTAMARAFFVDRTLDKFPGDMSEQERMAWASDNSAYVRMYPNSNLCA